ncbi:MAG TPA: hypothetical protein DDY16_05185 [Tenacibaculum sp.]|nr:hypothetical protein [Tenacibaculum sp.]
MGYRGFSARRIIVRCVRRWAGGSGGGGGSGWTASALDIYGSYLWWNLSLNTQVHWFFGESHLNM